MPVNGDDSVDLENTQLYKKPSRSSLTYVKTILQSPCCSSQLTVFIKVHLIFICSITAKKNASFPHDQVWISDMGIDGPTFVPKSSYFLLIWVKVCPQKLAFS